MLCRSALLGILIPGVFFFAKSVSLLNIGGIVGYMFFCITWILFLTRRLHYFGISDRFLIVRKANIYWFSKAYELDTIQEVIIERPYKMPVYLRLITRDSKSKLYLADSLWKGHWMLLKDELEKKGIKVRDEAHFY
jgi:hypothetical protein